jgi:D-beta-D-heptose 7-phosphate kinase/D-beta-D-heptose 1-phosphate adenosyltransferase
MVVLSSGDKIMTLEEALRWRNRQVGPVVFTNGVFDILHPGHVDLLEKARALGALLIVGVNDDDSARRLGKGEGRPVVRSDARMRVIAALAATDCVVSFSQPTPAQTISALRPDILVKGTDYEGQELPGHQDVVSRGGQVVLIPLISGYSSTAIVERIRAQTG